MHQVGWWFTPESWRWLSFGQHRSELPEIRQSANDLDSVCGVYVVVRRAVFGLTMVAPAINMVRRRCSCVHGPAGMLGAGCYQLASLTVGMLREGTLECRTSSGNMGYDCVPRNVQARSERNCRKTAVLVVQLILAITGLLAIAMGWAISWIETPGIHQAGCRAVRRDGHCCVSLLWPASSVRRLRSTCCYSASGTAANLHAHELQRKMTTRKAHI